jgi:hypothetical protein
MPKLPPLVAHRFGRAYGPDSSRRALRRALGGPLGGVETDCVLTRDGQIVLLHEPQLARSTDLEGWARGVDARTIRQGHLRDASGAITSESPLLLEEALDVLAEEPDLLVQLEVKAYADADLALRTAETTCIRALEHGGVRADRLEIISFWPMTTAVAAGHGLRSRVIVACAYTPQALAEWTSKHGVTGIILEGPYFASEPIRAWRAKGLSVMSGVVNDVESLTAILPFRPDLVSTDRPHELAAMPS